jgi:fido (protein-threonine AMPylation protein)
MNTTAFPSARCCRVSNTQLHGLRRHPPESVARLVDHRLEWWHEPQRALQGQPKEDVVVGLAELHHPFLKIHPFMDANGRVARDNQRSSSERTVERGDRSFIADTRAYYAALAAADYGDLKILQDRIKAALQ